METESKNIIITGGTGFIGSYLNKLFLREGHFLSVITRSPEKYSESQAKNLRYIGWDNDLSEAMEKADVVINLAGENLFGKRWTESIKKRLYDSRIESTRALTDAMQKAGSKPDLFISASAVGIYGDRGNEVLDESSPLADNFLAKLCKDWEEESKKAEEFGVRVANPRIGIVLEGDGGFVQIMKIPFMFFVGGQLGDGEQYIPWIHMHDLCRGIRYPMENEEISGPYNVCSPNPEKMKRLAKVMGRVMNRPSFFRVPEFAIELVLGEASQPALSSLRVQPKVLQQAGFQFDYEDLEVALADIL